MKSLIFNAQSIYEAVKSTVKTSYININLKSKQFDHQDNLSMEVQIGSVRNSKKDTSFSDDEYNNLISAIEYSLGYYQITKKDRKSLIDKKSKKNFEVIIIDLKPINF